MAADIQRQVDTLVKAVASGARVEDHGSVWVRRTREPDGGEALVEADTALVAAALATGRLVMALDRGRVVLALPTRDPAVDRIHGGGVS